MNWELGKQPKARETSLCSTHVLKRLPKIHDNDTKGKQMYHKYVEHFCDVVIFAYIAALFSLQIKKIFFSLNSIVNIFPKFSGL